MINITGKMLSEEALMKIMCYEKKITITILRVRYELNMTEIVAAGILCTAIGKLTLSLIYVEVDNLISFVKQVLLASTVLTAVVRLLTIISTVDSTREIHEKIIAVDDRLDKELSSKNDPELIALAGLVIWIIFSVSLWSFCLALTCENGLHFAVSLLAVVSLTMSVMPLVKVVALKQLIVKRLQHVASFDRLDLEIIVGCTRNLIGCNSDLNNGCWVQALFCAITLFHQCLSFLYFLWFDKDSEDFGPCSVFTALAHSGLYMIILLLAVYSSKVQDQIGEIQFKLDWAKQENKTSTQENEVMALFTMELHHARVALSAMGLFEFNRATIVAVVGALITYELVLIQYS